MDFDLCEVIDGGELNIQLSAGSLSLGFSRVFNREIVISSKYTLGQLEEVQIPRQMDKEEESSLSGF